MYKRPSPWEDRFSAFYDTWLGPALELYIVVVLLWGVITLYKSGKFLATAFLLGVLYSDLVREIKKSC